MTPITLNLQPTIELTDEQFALICIGPQNKQVEVYKSDCPVEVISNPVSLYGYQILPYFTLNSNNILG